MKKNVKRIIGTVYYKVVNEIIFLGRFIFRLLELFGQLFPEDAKGCRIRGLIYRPFLKKCGKNFQVGINAKLEHLYNIEIGDDVYIGHGCWISGIRGGIKFEDQVMLGPMVKMVSSNHTVTNNSFRFGKGEGAHITIGEGTWVAANAVITAGVTIGKCCLVAAGAVVTKNFNSYDIIGGIPSKKIGDCREKFNFKVE